MSSTESSTVAQSVKSGGDVTASSISISTSTTSSTSANSDMSSIAEKITQLDRLNNNAFDSNKQNSSYFFNSNCCNVVSSSNHTSHEGGDYGSEAAGRTDSISNCTGATGTNNSSSAVASNVNSVRDTVFTLKKWNLVAMWSWDVECEVCAICRTPLMGM
jgi:hypothetical protein